jgi:hypothetical protein
VAQDFFMPLFSINDTQFLHPIAITSGVSQSGTATDIVLCMSIFLLVVSDHLHRIWATLYMCDGRWRALKDLILLVGG